MWIHISIIFKVLFYILATFAHELAHYIAAKLTLSYVPDEVVVQATDKHGATYTKRIPGFNIIPEIDFSRGVIVMGSVHSSPKLKVFQTIISSAPLIWLYALYLYLIHMSVLKIDLLNEKLLIDWGILFSLDKWYILFISLQLLRAGTLSSQDIKEFFKGIFSISGLVFISIIYAFYHYSILETLGYYFQ